MSLFFVRQAATSCPKYMWNKAISWEGITPASIGVLVAIVLIGTYLIFCVYPIIRARSIRVQNIGSICMVGCGADVCKAAGGHLRGANYYDTPDIDTPAESGCILTGWEASHFVFHMFIGYWFNLQVSLITGIGFEVFEYFTCDCHSGFDILYNTLGALAGASFK